MILPDMSELTASSLHFLHIANSRQIHPMLRSTVRPSFPKGPYSLLNVLLASSKKLLIGNGLRRR